MKERLAALKTEALQLLEELNDPQQLNELRIKYLGKKGPITEVLRGMGALSAEERPLIGQIANDVREAIAQVIEAKQEEFTRKAVSERLKHETIDVSLPGRAMPLGAVHPLSKTIQDLEDIFIGMGYTIEEGPEIEQDYYNFEALNLPKEHPARDMQDSFYITDEILMRTHTSPVQVRTMERRQGNVPIKIVCPGRVYRRDDDDATHSHAFMQLEGLVVGRNIRMSDLKGTLLQFVKEMFGEGSRIRLRPGFFPFVEPGAEIDMSCFMCGGEGCRTCKQTGWIEILGAGMIHPRVLEMAGYDPQEYNGFAFGAGVERIAMLKHGIDDIRHFYMNDLRFLRQFARM